MTGKKSRLSKWFSAIGRSHSQKETLSTKSTEENVSPIQSRSPHPEPARDKGKAVQIGPNKAKNKPLVELKAEKSNDEGPQLAGDDPKTKRDDDKSDAERSAKRKEPVVLLPEPIQREHSVSGAD
jgi:hypothetical protein